MAFQFNPRHKFNNKKVETPEGVFDSKGEWQRWLFLKEAEKNGQISDLRRQVKYTLIPTQYRTEIVHLKTKDKEVQKVTEREVTYTADFVYLLPADLVVQRCGNEIRRLFRDNDYQEPNDEDLLAIVKDGVKGVYRYLEMLEEKEAKRLKVPRQVAEQWKRIAIQEAEDVEDFRKINSFRIVVEDFKGFPNDRWPLKKAMMLYFHGVAIREVKKPGEPI